MRLLFCAPLIAYLTSRVDLLPSHDNTICRDGRRDVDSIPRRLIIAMPMSPATMMIYATRHHYFDRFHIVDTYATLTRCLYATFITDYASLRR